MQFLLTPKPDLKARVIIDKLRSDERTNLSFPSDNGPDTWSDGIKRAVVTAPAGYTGSYVNYGYLGRFAQRAAWFHNPDGSVYQPRLGGTEFGNSEARPQITNQKGISSEVNWEVSDHTLTSITAFRYQDFDIKNGGNFDQFYISNGGQQLYNKQFSQELRVSSTPADNKALDYQVGLYYLRARVYSDDPTYYSPDAGAFNASNGQFNTLIATPAGRNLLRYTLDGVYQSSVTDARVNSLGLYGQTDWHLTKRTTLTTGARVTNEEKTNRISQQLDRPGQALTTANFAGATAAEIAAANAVRSSRVNAPYDFIEGTPIKDNLFAWNTGLSHKLNDKVLLYSSVGVGVKSGVVTWTDTKLDASGKLTPANLKPEKSLDFELGFKSLSFNDKLMFNLNVYRTKVSDYQTSVSYVQDDGITTGSRWVNAEGVLAQGIELETSYTVNRNLQLTATGALNKAVYDGEFLLVKPEVDTSLPQYAGRNGLVNLDGRQLSNAPKATLNVGIAYQQPVFGLLGRVNFGVSYRSGTYLATNQAASTYQQGYSIANLRLGLGSLNKSWEVSLLARNLFDKDYATSRSAYTSTGAGSRQIGAPRYVGVTLQSQL